MANEPLLEKLTCKWVGAAFFWLLKGFAGSYSDQFKPEYENRNIWAGYFINVVVFGSIFYFFIVRK